MVGDEHRAETLRALRQLCGKVARPVETREQPRLSLGIPVLDALLPGRGLERGALVEWLSPVEGSGVATLALQGVRAALEQHRVWAVVDDTGEFHPPAARGWGVPLESLLLLLRPTSVADAVWTVEQCLRWPLWQVQRRLSKQPELRARPLILFAEGRRGLVVSACSPEAMRFGISAGMPLGEARSLLPTTASRRSRQSAPKPVFQRADPVAVRMEVVELGLPPIRQATLFEDDAGEKHQRALAELVDRLSSRLGREAVLRSSLQPDPLPEFSCATLPWLEQRPSAVETVTIPSRLRCRPLRLLRLPQPLAIDRFSPEGWPTHVDQSPVVRVSGPERIESGWWRGVDAKRDYYRLTLATGAALWAFCDRNSGRWFLHGLFD